MEIKHKTAELDVFVLLANRPGWISMNGNNNNAEDVIKINIVFILYKFCPGEWPVYIEKRELFTI